jgi:hypothetical protein
MLFINKIIKMAYSHNYNTESEEEYDTGYGSPDEDPPSQEEINLREGEKIYKRIFWYLIIMFLLYPYLVIKSGNLFQILNQTLLP